MSYVRVKQALVFSFTNITAHNREEFGHTFVWCKLQFNRTRVFVSYQEFWSFCVSQKGKAYEKRNSSFQQTSQISPIYSTHRLYRYFLHTLSSALKSEFLSIIFSFLSTILFLWVNSLNDFIWIFESFLVL